MRLIALTCGDPGGIGPEIVMASLRYCLSECNVIPVVIASGPVLEAVREWQPSDISLRPWPGRDHVREGDAYGVLLDSDPNTLPFEIKTHSAVNGRLAASYIEKAVTMAMAGDVDAIVTAPISKTSLRLAGYTDTGHTTMLQRLTQASEVSMGFYTPQLKTVLSTIHVPLATVPALLSHITVGRAIRHADTFGKLCGITSPRIAVAGLNPHLGEDGLFGHDDERMLRPIVESFAGSSIDVTGPYPADSLYYRAVAGEFDVVVSLYHDQGLIPIKLLGFGSAVNVTLGLPIIRTSVDHGTAFDIAYSGKASSTSFKAAIAFACQCLPS